MKLEIVTPQRVVLTKEAEEVEVPCKLGYVGILPGHTPFFSLLGMGELWFRKGTERGSLFVNGGYMDVLPDKVTILADEVVEEGELSLRELEEQKRAQEATVQKGLKGEVSVEEFHKALETLRRLQVLLSLAKS